MLAWGPPHNPYETAPTRYRDRFSAANIHVPGNVPDQMTGARRKDLAGYYAHGAALDDCIGDLLATLRETGLDSNTIIIFTADHGDLLGAHGQQRKQQPYDESIRVPMLVHWPMGLGTEPRRIAAPLGSPDIMPTLLGLCGVRIPRTVEGLDFSACVRGGADPSGGATLIECPAPFGEWIRTKGGREYRGIRTTRYTYVRDLNRPWLLYDNQLDPLQMTNLVGTPQFAQTQTALDKILRQKLAGAHDDFKPAAYYLKKWQYAVDSNGTMPFDP
jgi:arylsulfatase A-like enzyme